MSANIGQDDIDKLLNDALGGIAGDGDKAQSQDDIDALLAAAANGSDIGPAAKPAVAAAPDAAQNQSDIDALLAAANAAPGTADTGGTANQDDIDALLAAANAAPGTADTGGTANQDDIDALLAAANAAPGTADTGGTANQDDIDALLAAANAAPGTADTGGTANQNDIDALLAAANSTPTPAAPAPTVVASPAVAAAEEPVDLLRSAADEIAAVASAVPPIPTPQPAAAPAIFPTVKIPAPVPVPPLDPERLAALQESLSLAGSSGEVESISGQIAELLGQLSEKSRRYQAAYLAADQQTRELRYLVSLNEQKLHGLVAEKTSALTEADGLRKQFSRSEGEKLAASEAHRTEIAALQLRIREQESRNQMLQSESNALKEELERARNAATGSDLEGRRARFDAERLQGELSAERQERQRLARALENREKELQAMQAQAAGHASTLFLDELHRLVRRLESELDLRGRAAQEAVAIFERMEFAPEMQIYAATLRAALCSAAGLTPDESDALKSLDQNGERLKSTPLEPAVAPGEDTFVKALTRYDFARASGIASALMRAGGRTPYECMKELYQLEALKHPEISNHLDELTSLLRGVKNLQEASDRSRGRESELTEKMLVMMFDLLHALVRLKLVSRATTPIWEFFLELRGRFSFLTSDRQWQEYRDRILSRKLSAVA